MVPGEIDSNYNKLLRHASFGKVLELAAALKHQQSQLAAVAQGQAEPLAGVSQQASTTRKKVKLESDGSSHPQNIHGDRESEFDSAAELIRTTLIQNDDGADLTLSRGECAITDSLIDETIQSLADELKMCLDLKKQLKKSGPISRQESQISQSSSFGAAMPPQRRVVPSIQEQAAVTTSNKGNGKKKKDTKPPPGMKFSKWQTDVLTEWMILNREHPFPSPDEITALATAANMTELQIVNWTTNVRKRNQKATVEGKKPFHFLDFLFLADDREQKMLDQNPHIDLSQFNQAAKHNKIALQGFGGGNDAPAPPQYAPYAFQSSPPPPSMLDQSQKLPPRAPSNIFRGVNTSPPTDKQGDLERNVLQAYAPNGMGDTPPTFFDRSSPPAAAEENFDEVSGCIYIPLYVEEPARLKLLYFQSPLDYV